MPFMPLFVKVTDWQQTPTNVTIKIPSYGIIAQNVNVFTSDKYIKAHYGQHFFELFLWSLIDTSKSTCVITHNEIIFELTKWSAENWDKLEAELDKGTKRELRKQIIEETQKKNQEEDEQKVTRHAELKRVAVREQISIDTKRYDWIKNVKQNETEKALRELKLWEENKCTQEKEINTNNVKTEYKKSNDKAKYKSSNKIKQKQQIYTPELKEAPAVPVPRKYQSLCVKFTNREFPTPTRESMAQEEEEWLAKQAAARRSAGFVKEDLRPEERNPQWLKAKGDQFYKDGNYLGALSAYSEGIRLSAGWVDLWSARAAAHLAAGNLQRCVEDCSSALDLMKPQVPSNQLARAECIGRRGKALCQLGLKEQGIKEIDIAWHLARPDDKLKAEIEKIKQECI